MLKLVLFGHEIIQGGPLGYLMISVIATHTHAAAFKHFHIGGAA